MLRVLAASLLLGVLVRPADACEDHVFSRTIDGIAADGSFVYVERNFGGRVFETVNVANAAGKRIAWCEREDEGAWQCGGDRRFRATRAVSGDRIAKGWTAILGPTSPLVDMDAAPSGVTRAICARVAPVMTTGMQIDCEPTNAEPLDHPSSPLVFLRFHVKPFRFCGSTSTHDEVTWVARPALVKRLAQRGSLFAARKRLPLAREALEGLVYLEPGNADAEAALERVRGELATDR